MDPKVIFEDSSLMVIDKPSGWVVNDADTTKNLTTVQSWLSKKDFPISKDRELRSGIVHRLDKETSGLLIVAKTKDSFEKLQSEFKERKVKKMYVALVHGKVLEKEGEINASVGRLPWRRERFGVLPGGREALTGYKVLRYYDSEKGEYTLLEITPKTGRTHQIRIHLKYIGYPIVGDSFYAGRKTARDDREWCPRLFLHAKEITFFHPETGKEINLSSEMPEDLEGCLSQSSLHVS